MNLGEITALHIGKSIIVKPGGLARIVDGVRHFTVRADDGKATLRRTSVMLRSTGAKPNDPLGEHIGDAGDQVTIGNG